MASTLLKYHLKRWLLPLLGSCVFFGGLLIANDLVQISRDIFSQGAPIKWLVPIVVLTLPETLALVLPMAAILGGLLGTQHLSEGSEMVASQGLGVGMRSILKAWALLSLGLVVAASINAHYIVPNVSVRMDRVQDQMTEETKTRFLRPGGPPFFPPRNPQTGIWVSPGGEVHMFEVTDSTVQHLVARDLAWKREETPGKKPSIIMNLMNLKGCYYQKRSDSVGLLAQQSQLLRVDLPTRRQLLAPTDARNLPTGQLLVNPTKERWIEFERRITLPFSTIAFLLLGIALGLGHPRFRKGGALVRSLGVILLYYLLMKLTENMFMAGKRSPLPLFLPPLVFLAAGVLLLNLKMRPHRTPRFSLAALNRHGLKVLQGIHQRLRRTVGALPIPFPAARPVRKAAPGVLGRWTQRLWWRNWGATLGSLVTLNLLIEFARLAGDLSKHGTSYLVFLQYWFWSLPSFLVLAFPMSFLLGGVLTLSDAAVSREWVALRAGGTSLVRWIGSGAKAWLSVLLITFMVHAVVSPAVENRSDTLNRIIKHKPTRKYQTRPWMNLTSQEVLWFLEKDHRWGFPLKSPGEGPILYRWERNSLAADQLRWDSLTFEPGPKASDLFPDEALRRNARAEETSTLDLFRWQEWAPDSERASMLWGRLLDWLAGPCLMFAMLAFAFPAPRGGRGQVLGTSVVVGLLFLGMQALFGGAAGAGEIPALWGVLAPLLILVGSGFFNLKYLKT
ncbi:MAG TPA: LptF/LptG family permease [Holophaga sp.]|nr:LptF/LptG family permease [Holophaga sp.]